VFCQAKTGDFDSAKSFNLFILRTMFFQTGRKYIFFKFRVPNFGKKIFKFSFSPMKLGDNFYCLLLEGTSFCAVMFV